MYAYVSSVTSQVLRGNSRDDCEKIIAKKHHCNTKTSKIFSQIFLWKAIKPEDDAGWFFLKVPCSTVPRQVVPFAWQFMGPRSSDQCRSLRHCGSEWRCGWFIGIWEISFQRFFGGLWGLWEVDKYDIIRKQMIRILLFVHLLVYSIDYVFIHQVHIESMIYSITRLKVHIKRLATTSN